MSPSIWMRLSRFYGYHFPITRGKARVVRWIYHMVASHNHSIMAIQSQEFLMEFYPWIWSDFASYAMGSPELYHLKHFKSQIKVNSIVFDIGAYLGTYALTASQIATKGAVYAFEPNPDTAQRVKNAIASCRKNNLHFYQSAVSDFEGEMNLAIGDYPPQSKLADRPGECPGKNIIFQPVQVMSIDQFCEAENIPRIDIIKIDVEGAELKVLLGAERIVSNTKPEMIIEVHPEYSAMFGYSINELIECLHTWGYNLYTIGFGLINPQLIPFSADLTEITRRKIIIAQPKHES